MNPPPIFIRSINARSLVNPMMDSTSIISVLQQFILLMFHNGGIGAVSKVTLAYVKPASNSKLFKLSEPSDRYYSAIVHFHYLYNTPQTWSMMNHFDQERKRQRRGTYTKGYSIWVNAGVGYLLIDRHIRPEFTSIMNIDQVVTSCVALEGRFDHLDDDYHKTIFAIKKDLSSARETILKLEETILKHDTVIVSQVEEIFSEMKI